MIKTPLTIQDYQRCENAKVAVKGIRNRAPSKFCPQAISLAVYILALLNQAMDYTRHNVGEVIPTPFTNLFDHSAATVMNLEKARQKLKSMYALLDGSQRSELKAQYTLTSELLKDWKAYITKWARKELDHA